MYHVSRFWPFGTILYITKMHPTSENCFFFVFKLILKQKKFWLRFDYANFIFRSENSISSAKIDMKPIFFILPSFSSPQILPKKSVWGCLSRQKKFTRPSPLNRVYKWLFSLSVTEVLKYEYFIFICHYFL